MEFSDTVQVRQMASQSRDFAAIDAKEPVFMPVMSLRTHLSLLKWLVSLTQATVSGRERWQVSCKAVTCLCCRA